MTQLVINDIVLAVSLKCLGYHLDKLEKIEFGRGTFTFSNVPSSVVDDYERGKLLVEPVSFNSHFKALTRACKNF